MDNELPAPYFEEFLLNREGEYPTFLGTRLVQENSSNPALGFPARALGFAGRQEFLLTKPIELTKGLNKVTIKASPAKPIPVRTMLQKLEGRRD